ncbi:DUF2510 domain-containing protein [Leifsonia sp. 21MFCrub1.1]|uniref:DUF2510 domain-containing protein n=1 Tax=Leifsonia sp. 21MFCrub1.1 TaxID=1798223 RepID=UPI0008929B1E|nr:DUF2510 domain-containing protein [Leifsonia sp. 21MFCrub1.1]SEA33890.1 Protein of unknown function [Leifsonia sp. 21MFCrub1.1]
MTDQTTPAAGWYPDPNGSGALRWWDGSRWGDQLAAAPTAYAPARRRPLAPGTPLYTVWIWLVAVLPVASGLLLFLLHPQPMFRFSADGSSAVLTDPFALVGGPIYFVVLGLSWVLAAAMIVFSWLDYRELLRRGMERPFHWAWSFLGIVYPIGRSVVVRGVAGGRGLAPLWVAIAAYVVSLVLSVVWSIILISEILGTVAQNLPAGA